MSGEGANSVKTRDVLDLLGFEEDWTAMADELPAYAVDLGNIKFTVARQTNRFLRPVFTISGVAADRRTVKMISSELPLQVESYEQGVALLAHAIGADYEPEQPAEWLEQGRSWQHLLPWEREKAAYAARPACGFAREWFRVAGKRLRVLAEAAHPSDITTFSFDGQVLKIDAAGEILAMPAAGAAWDAMFAVSLCDLRALPKRLTFDPVSVEVWEGRLSIARLSLPLVNPDTGETRG
ncbi:MAG TPA: hypothetical protein PK706_24590 [Xanthobacteraceae bacterium]|jgi:hypothetical protein|nr:hypothetical protein [Xanthobacteraceae bacterium]